MPAISAWPLEDIINENRIFRTNILYAILRSAKEVLKDPLVAPDNNSYPAYKKRQDKALAVINNPEIHVKNVSRILLINEWAIISETDDYEALSNNIITLWDDISWVNTLDLWNK